MKSLLVSLLIVFYIPSFAGVVILNGLTHMHTVTGGVSISGKIKVQNNGNKEAKILIYEEDLLISCDKPVDYSKTAKHERSLGGWMKTNIEEKVLQPNEVYDIDYTIAVSKEAVGSYWSMLMIEAADPFKEEVNQGVKIDSKIRYAVLIIANAGTMENSKIGFEQMKITPQENLSQLLNVKLKNTGIFVAPTKLSVEIYDEKGNKVKTVGTNVKKVYPEKCTDFELVIKDLPKGKYDGVLIADNGKDLFGANINLEINE